MQTAIEEKRQVFDFLRGDEPYKAKWTGLSHSNLRRLITRSRTPFVPLARQMHMLETRIETSGKAWMRRKKKP